MGWGKLNQKCQASSDFLFQAPRPLIAINTCLDEMEEFKGRENICERLAYKKKVFKSCEVLLKHI